MLPGMFNRTASNAGASSGYTGHPIPNSAEFDGSSDYESRIYTSGDRRTNTFHWGFRILDPDHRTCLLSAGTASNGHLVDMENGGLAAFKVSGGAALNMNTNQRFRDPHAFAMLTMRFDTTQATDSDRVKFWWNGIEGTWDNVIDWPSLNSDLNFSNNVTHYLLGRFGATNAGKLALSYFIHQEGVAGDHLTVGEFYDGGTKYRPIDFSGIDVGTEGVILDFTNGADLGEDQSSNGNDWTVSGSPNQITDSPTKNYAVLSPIDGNSDIILENGNRTGSKSSGSYYHNVALSILPSGKRHYVEFEVDELNSGNQMVGALLLPVDTGKDGSSGPLYDEGYCFLSSGDKRDNGVDSASWGSGWAVNDVIQLAIDATDLTSVKIWYGINNTWQGGGDPAAGTSPAHTITEEVKLAVAPGYSGSGKLTLVSSSDDQTYTAPTNFDDLTAASVEDPTIEDPGEHFNAVGYTGNGTAIGSGGNAVTGVGFEPDFTWIKNLDGSNRHQLYDVLRGVTNYLESDTTNTEGTEAEGLTSFDSDGFTVGSNSNHNTNSQDYISLNWKAGGSGVANTDGSISSVVSVNDDAGFSIVTYTGAGSAGTVGHGQSGAPEMVIQKTRTDDVGIWHVYHKGVAADAETDYLTLDNNSAATDDAAVWNDTAPTDTVVALGNGGDIIESGDTFLLYCFRSIPGFSKVFAFDGDGSSSGIFVPLGFKPKFIIYRNTIQAGNGWPMWDSARSPVNGRTKYLTSNNSNAEADAVTREIDFLCNGFRTLGTSTEVNRSGDRFCGIAFAENPFGGSNIPLGLAA